MRILLSDEIYEVSGGDGGGDGGSCGAGCGDGSSSSAGGVSASGASSCASDGSGGQTCASYGVGPDGVGVISVTHSGPPSNGGCTVTFTQTDNSSHITFNYGWPPSISYSPPTTTTTTTTTCPAPPPSRRAPSINPNRPRGVQP